MRKSIWLASASFALLAAGSSAQAQDNGQTPVDEGKPTTQGAIAQTPTELGEIIVTATRRAQALSDVPIAVSAVTAESMANSGATDIRQLNQLAPSLLVSSTGTESNGSARIRGIGTVGDNPGLESSVTVFIDGVYRSRSGIGLNELGDIERIEVLRGPQGTLFGRNASAGLINIISKSPSFETEGYAEATYGNYDFMRFAGGVAGPIVDDLLAFRVDGVFVQRDGFLKDIVSNNRVNDRDRYFMRGQLLIEPNDDLKIRVIGDYTHRNEECCGATYLPVRETVDPTPGVPGDFAGQPNRILSVLQSLGGIVDQDTFSRRISVTPGRSYENTTEDWGLSAQADWDLGFGTLTSITGYREYKSGGAGDFDYNNVDIVYRTEESYRKFQTFSQELRLQGTLFDDRLDWLVGGYFADEKLKLTDDLTFGAQYGAFSACRIVATVNPNAALRNPAAAGCLSPAGTAALTAAFGPLAPAFIGGLNRLSTVSNVGDNVSVYNQKSQNWALFTHNVFDITDRLSLTLGARYTEETKKFSADIINNNAACPAQQAALGPVLAGLPSTPATANARALLAGIINLTCQGNSSPQLNGLTLRDRRDDNQWTGTAVLSYDVTDDLMAYGSYSKGYKAGGFNLDRSALGSPLSPRSNADVANLQFAPEKVDAFEIGAKYTGTGFNVNVAAFHQAFKSFQLNTFNGSVFIVQNINSCGTDLNGADRDNSATTGSCSPNDIEPGVTSKGVEIEAAMFPTDDIAVTAGMTYADTKYRNDLVGSDNGVPLDPVLFLLPGNAMSNAPKYVVTSSFTYTPQLTDSGLSALFYIDTRLTSDYNTGSDLFPEKEQDGYALVNARVGLRGPDQAWSVELWAQNLFDVDYQQVAFNTPFQGANTVAQTQAFGLTANQLFSSYLAEPRTFGVTVRTRF